MDYTKMQMQGDDRPHRHTIGQDRDVSEIDQEFRKLEANVEVVASRIVQLLDRLSPVIKPHGVNAVGVNEKSPPKMMSPVGSKLELISERLAELAGLISDADAHLSL